jgi:hypothetical protein
MGPLHRERFPISRALSTYLWKSPEKKPPLWVPLMEPLHTERCSVSRAVFTYLSKFPEKEPPSRFPFQVTIEIDYPFPEPSSTCLSKSLVKEPPLQVPHWGPCGERCSSPGSSIHMSQSSQ